MDNLHAHPLTMLVVVTRLVPKSSGTAFSLSMSTHSMRTRKTTLELLSKLSGWSQCPGDTLLRTCHRLHQTISHVPESSSAGPAVPPTFHVTETAVSSAVV